MVLDVSPFFQQPCPIITRCESNQQSMTPIQIHTTIVVISNRRGGGGVGGGVKMHHTRHSTSI